MFYTQFNTRFCEITLVGNRDGLANLHLATGEGNRVFQILPEWELNGAHFDEAKEQITDYFEGKRKEFDLTISPAGTEFQKKVWNELCRIPYGETRTYGEIGNNLGSPGLARAVGTANGKNPLPIIIPCHRVIGTGGKLAGFAYGLTIKRALIQLEAEY